MDLFSFLSIVIVLLISGGKIGFLVGRAVANKQLLEHQAALFDAGLKIGADQAYRNARMILKAYREEDHSTLGMYVMLAETAISFTPDVDNS